MLRYTRILLVIKFHDKLILEINNIIHKYRHYMKYTFRYGNETRKRKEKLCYLYILIDGTIQTNLIISSYN